MKNLPRISVIIPTFNRSSFLYEAVTSVLGQSLAGFEILVVDDGSTDDTAQIIAGLSDQRVEYIYQENAGRSTARNRGLARASGDYIAFLDDDDLYLPHKLSVQAAFLDSHPQIGLVAGGAEIINADGSHKYNWRGWEEQPDLSLPACLYACPVIPSTVLMRKSCLDALEYWFDPDLEPAEDTDFWIRLLVSGCQMAWNPQIISAYRQHLYNSQQDAERYHRGFIMLLNKLFSRSDLPHDLAFHQPMLYAHYYVLGACYAYETNRIQTGQNRLLQSGEVAPGVLKESPPLIISLITGAVQSRGSDPAALIEKIFKNLPSELAWLKPYRGYALSTLHMRRVFQAHTSHEQPLLKDWLLGVYHYPRWLMNRGVWSILMHDLVLSSNHAG